MEPGLPTIMLATAAAHAQRAGQAQHRVRRTLGDWAQPAPQAGRGAARGRGWRLRGGCVQRRHPPPEARPLRGPAGGSHARALNCPLPRSPRSRICGITSCLPQPHWVERWLLSGGARAVPCGAARRTCPDAAAGPWQSAMTNSVSTLGYSLLFTMASWKTIPTPTSCSAAQHGHGTGWARHSTRSAQGRALGRAQAAPWGAQRQSGGENHRLAQRCQRRRDWPVWFVPRLPRCADCGWDRIAAGVQRGPEPSRHPLRRGSSAAAREAGGQQRNVFLLALACSLLRVVSKSGPASNPEDLRPQSADPENAWVAGAARRATHVHGACLLSCRAAGSPVAGACVWRRLALLRLNVQMPAPGRG
jgi:hypothetical protein